MEEVKKNYLKEFYQAETHDYSKIFNNISLERQKEILQLKRNVKKLQKMIDEEETKIGEKYIAEYGKHYTPVNERVVIKYDGRNMTAKFDLISGAFYNDEDDENDVDEYYVYSKRGEVYVVVGYDYETASIIVNLYKYSITNNGLNTKLERMYNIPFLEDENNGSFCNINNKDIQKTDFISYDLKKALGNVKGSSFINNLYGVDYNGSFNLKEMIETYHSNKSFEIILKTAPKEIVDMLLNNDYKECKPIYKLLGIAEDIYNKAIERGVIVDVVKSAQFFKDSQKYNKTGYELLNFIEDMKEKEEDLKFYNISYTGYGSYGRCDSLAQALFDEYSNQIFYSNYSLGKFANYVVDETINQGYTSIYNFIKDLKDYISMCTACGITPSLYTAYLKQTHDMTARNYKIKVEQESEQIFAKRYEGFKEWKNNDYIVTNPKNTNDLKNEGYNLNHCVASYIKKVIDGTCLILFLRHKADESLITFEVRNEAIVQVRGMHNRKPTEKEVEALKAYATKNNLEVRFN